MNIDKELIRIALIVDKELWKLGQKISDELAHVQAKGNHSTLKPSKEELIQVGKKLNLPFVQVKKALDTFNWD